MTFVRTRTGKAEAKAGCHDDEVMAFGIALQVDMLAPMDQDAVEKVRKEEARDMASAVGKAFEKDSTPPMTREEKCFAHVMARRMEKERMQEDLWGGEELNEW